jgi:hypothetical protein
MKVPSSKGTIERCAFLLLFVLHEFRGNEFNSTFPLISQCYQGNATARQQQHNGHQQEQ